MAPTPAAGQTCQICGQRSPLVSSHLGVCGRCLRERPAETQPLVQAAHGQTRREFGQTAEPPQTAGGVQCPLCAHRCTLGEGQVGLCGLRMAHAGRLVHLAGHPSHGLVRWYRDPLPTNCVAMPFCAGRGRPGYHNLAVFYGSCSFNCLFCQNWHYRDMLPSQAALASGRRADRSSPTRARRDRHAMSAAELAAAATQRTFCVCFFGGDPSSQMPHALAAAAQLARQGVTICWETSGAANPRLMDRAVGHSLQTGGTTKLDLKALDDNLHRALTGASNRQTLENLSRAARRLPTGPHDPAPLMVSTLLVPGYVDTEEVGAIARYIASLDRHIPYTLLGFAPSFYMSDLPCTSVGHAREAVQAAQAAGLTRVRVGNRHLLSRDY